MVFAVSKDLSAPRLQKMKMKPLIEQFLPNLCHLSEYAEGMRSVEAGSYVFARRCVAL